MVKGRNLSLWLSISLLMLSAVAIAQHTCNHRHAFERSPVADSVDAVHYRIHITNIDFEQQTIEAVTSLSLRPRLALSVIPLELKYLTVSQVLVNGTQATGFTQSGEMLRVETGQTWGVNDTILLEIHYGGQPFHENWGGFHFSGNYAFNLGVGFVSDPHNLGKAWFPCVDDFQDRATYEVLITVPDHMKGISGGSLIETIDVGNGYKTWHWSLQQSIPTYLASVAVGAYELVEGIYEGLQANIPITIYTRPADTGKVEGSFQNLHQVMQFFEASFDPYPWERIGYTGTAIGAMEHVTNIAYPHSAINGNLSSEYLMAHEISHMWFGNKVTCSSAEEMWLNEGWATFCHHYYRKQIYGYDNYLGMMKENHYEVLKNTHIIDNGYHPLNNIPTQYTYGSTVYKKGASVVHSLMNYLGEDVFHEAVKAYLEAFAFSSASSYDMRDVMSAHTGIDLSGFFDTWVFTPGTPHYSIDSIVVEEEMGEYETRIHLKKKHKGAIHAGNGHIIEVTARGANWQLWTDTVHFDGESGLSVKLLPFEPLIVMADFYDKSCDATTDEHKVITETGEYVFSKPYFKLYADALTDSAFIRISHHWAPPDSLKQSVEGLTLSPYRYWGIDGIIPENSELRGRFFYSDANTLDNTLIQSENDSVVILYRPTSAHEWEWVDQVQEGLWSVGYIYVNELKKGEYTLAVWDRQLVGLAPKPETNSKTGLIISPNPATDSVSIGLSLNETAILTISNSLGKQVYDQQIDGASTTEIGIANWMSGVYIISVNRLNGTSLTTGKLVIP